MAKLLPPGQLHLFKKYMAWVFRLSRRVSDSSWDRAYTGCKNELFAVRTLAQKLHWRDLYDKRPNIPPYFGPDLNVFLVLKAHSLDVSNSRSAFSWTRQGFQVCWAVLVVSVNRPRKSSVAWHPSQLASNLQRMPSLVPCLDLAQSVTPNVYSPLYWHSNRFETHIFWSVRSLIWTYKCTEGKWGLTSERVVEFGREDLGEL